MTLLLLVALAQSPQVPQVPQSPEVGAFSAFVDRHLLVANVTFNSLEVKQHDRVFRVEDEDFEEAFKLVPETLALALARSGREQYLLSNTLQTIGLVFLGAAVVPIVLTVVLSGALIPLLIAAAGGFAVSLAFSVMAGPIALAAQEKLFSAVGSYNRGLLRLTPPPQALTLLCF